MDMNDDEHNDDEHTKTIANYFDINCPGMGNFYICDNATTQFIGCCMSAPCERHGLCSDTNLANTTFAPTQYSEILGQECVRPEDGYKWYTCQGSDTSPSFMGCCSVDPCISTGGIGCPPDKLGAAKLSSSERNRTSLIDPPGISFPASSTATSTAEPTTKSRGLSTGSIAGIAVGSAVIFCALVGILIWRCCVLSRKRRQMNPQLQQPAPPMTQPNGIGPYDAQQTPANYHQASFNSSPTAIHYPSGISIDTFGKFSPPPSNYDLSPSVNNYSNPNSFVGGYNQYLPPTQMVPVQEMDITRTEIAPGELSTGQEHNIQHNMNEKHMDASSG